MEPIKPIKLFDGCILHKVPHATGTGAGTETASDAQIFIHDIFVGIILQFFFTDCRSRADGDTDAAVPAGTAG